MIGLDFREINGIKLKEFEIILITSGAKHVEQCRFEIFLQHAKQGKSSIPVISGLYSEGRQPYLRNWMDMDYFPAVEFKGGKKADLHGTETEKSLFRLLGRIIEPNGSMMVSYELFSGEHQLHRETRKMLEKQTPPILTPIGQLLLEAGCWSNIRDWYIPEGGKEGNKKLQGWKPLNYGVRKKRRKEAVREVEAYAKKVGNEVSIDLTKFMGAIDL